jgi:hypothetical protein
MTPYIINKKSLIFSPKMHHSHGGILGNFIGFWIIIVCVWNERHTWSGMYFCKTIIREIRAGIIIELSSPSRKTSENEFIKCTCKRRSGWNCCCYHSDLYVRNLKHKLDTLFFH